MYPKILVPLDGSDTAAQGLQEAIALARQMKSQLRLLHVVDDYPLMVEMASVVNFEGLRQSMRQYGQDVLDKAKRLAADQDVEADTQLCEITHGRVAEAIIEQTAALGCSLVVMGTHGRRGLSRTMMGSDAEQVARASSVPVLLVRRPEGIP